MQTVRDIIKKEAGKLTKSEQKIASAILADYPFGGLQTIQELGDQIGVSAPSITRFVSKVGFGGYLDFQRRLIAELKERHRSPLDMMASTKEQESDFLADYSRRVAARVSEMADNVSQDQFDRILRLVSDPSRNIFLIGGRISDSIASFLAIHLQQLRPNVFHIPSNPERWPDAMLSMRKRDVVIMLDFRRYQPDLERLSGRIARKRHASIVLITDKWMSPIARHSNIVVALPIDSGTAWDTVACAIAFVEALIVKVSDNIWPTARKRIAAWDSVRLSSPDDEEYQRTEWTNEA